MDPSYLGNKSYWSNLWNSLLSNNRPLEKLWQLSELISFPSLISHIILNVFSNHQIFVLNIHLHEDIHFFRKIILVFSGFQNFLSQIFYYNHEKNFRSTIEDLMRNFFLIIPQKHHILCKTEFFIEIKKWFCKKFFENVWSIRTMERSFSLMCG